MMTLVELLRGRAAEDLQGKGYTFLRDDGESESLSFRDLDERARGVAALLQERARPGDRALLLYAPGLDFIAAFFGCLYAGVVAVPAYPPQSKRSFPRLLALARDARPAVALTTSALLRRLEPARAQMPELAAIPCLATDQEVLDPGAWRDPGVRGESLAFLQYTSGSTALPKGVMVTHAHLLHNEEMIRQAFGMSGDSVVVGWLPLYHDMGLIGNVLQPLYAGASCVLMSPTAFLQQPFRWLDAISRFRGTTGGGPNFAYELCVRKISEEQRERLDLRSWTVAYNGAEPVRAGTLERFAAAFEPCGFRRSAFYPCYGLAEATLFVAGAAPHREPRVVAVDAAALEAGEAVAAGDGPDRELVGCGGAWLEQRVLVVDPEAARPLPAGRIGEIWVSGPSVAQGYWGQPEVTERELRARLDDVAGEARTFLRTGDLGFLQDGELFVTGRLKDLIILRGRNLYPQDVEQSSEGSHPALRAGGAAAFSVEVDGEERLVVVQEVERRFAGDPEELAAAIRQAVAEAHDARVHAVALIQAGTLPKTSSGKVQRRACRDQFLHGRLAMIHGAPDLRFRAPHPPAPSPIPSQPPGEGEKNRSFLSLEREEAPLSRGLGGDGRGDGGEGPGAPATFEPSLQVLAFLRGQVAKLAGLPLAAVDAARPVTALGLDSLGAVELSHRVEERFGFLPPLAALLEGASLHDIAGWIAGWTAAAPNAEAGRIETAGDEEGDLPLSYGQRALWLLQRLDPSDAAYNINAALRVEGPLDVDTLAEAAGLVVRRHSSLRSSFHPGPDGPVRRVHRRRDPAVLRIDAAAWSAEELSERLHGEAWRPFDLQEDPLLRLAVFRRGEGEHVVLVTIHHIVADLWSLAVLKRDLDRTYRMLRGEAAEIPAAPRLRYADFVRWQEQRMAGPEGERLWQSWRETLAGELPETTLAPDRPPAAQSKAGGSLTAFLDAEVCGGLRRLGGGGNTTLSTVLLTGFLALLQRYTGEDDLLVGVPTDGRERPELSELVGYLVNPVVVRADLAGDPAFAAALARVRAAALAAFERREMPFPLLVERLQPERAAGRSPLFQTLFVFQRSPAEAAVDLGPFALGAAGAAAELAGLPATSVAIESRAVGFDLELVTAEAGSQVGLALRYDAGRYERATLERLLGHYGRLLAGAVADPAQTLSALPLWSAAELRHMLSELNRSGEVLADGATVHGLFFAQARRSPEATAVIAGNEEVTYRVLAERAAGLAHFLLAQGVGPEEPVAVCLDRRIDLVAALLGVMAAGGAYVPIDPAYPPERQTYLLEDSGARLVLTRSELDAAWEAEPAGEPLQLPPETPPGLAYLIYTSGSTGRPKGVAIEHRSAVAMIRWALDVFPAETLARTVAATSVCFDLSVFELFVPLAGGGTVVLVDNALALPAAAEAQPTLLNTVPSALAELLRQGALPASVRTVNLAGEPLPRALAEAAYRTGTVERVFNLYGPSEDTTYSTWAPVPPGPDLPVTIGRPVTGTRAYVLDARMRPAPFGAVGELYLGGAGLARGYFRRPALTAERFVPDPYGDEPGGRLYRTGDRVRYRMDGELEILGRIDQQVKVRGFRIEPGEVEAALTSMAEVREALVTTFELRPGDLHLAAYVVPAEGSGATAESLRAALRERLPELMIPTLWVLLPALPRTPNGKVDRKALPAPEIGAGEAGGTSPRGEMEELLAGLWAEVLQVDRIGAHDNFFTLGGHSLLASRLLTRANAAFGVELPLRAVFEHPTVAGLAARIQAARRGDRAAQAPPVRPVPRAEEGGLPLSFAQEGLWSMDRLLPAGSPLHNVFQALRLTGPLAVRHLEAAFAEVARRHEVLRSVFPAVSGEPVQRVLTGWTPAMPVEDLAHLPAAAREARVGDLAVEAARTPFDLADGPLLRLRLLALGPEEHVLLLTLHHIVCDDWSVGLLVREVKEVYDALCAERAPRLPELPVQYADFAVWQRAQLTGAALEEKLAYWKAHLGSNPPVLTLPTDRPRPAVQTFRGASRRVRLPAALAAGLRAAARSEGATLFMALLAGYAAMLSRVAGQPEVVVGCASANRDRKEIEGLVGFFVNILPLRLDLSGDLTWRDLLRRVREAALGAYNHPDVPFDRLAAAVQPRRDLAHGALRQVGFAFENHVGGPLELAGVTSRALEVETGVARLDLTLFLWEEPGNGDLVGVCEHSTDLFDPATVDRFLERCERYLGAIADGAGGLDRRLPDLVSRVALPAVQMPESNLTSSQLLFWFAHTLSADVQLYFDLATTTYEIAGALEIEPFQRAFQRLVDHCDALRSTIRAQGGIPLRIVRERMAAPVELVDLSTAADPRAAWESWLAARCQRTLDLGERLFDAALVRLAADRFVWFWNVHHIIADAWSLVRIAEELSRYYALARAGRLDEAQPLPSYQLYVDYERELRNGRRWERAREYWEHKLAAPWTRNLFYRRDPALRTTRAARHTADLGAAGSAAVRDLTARHDLFSPAVIFATVLFSLIHRLSGERTLRIGTPFANRSDEFADVVGLQMNACALQIQMDDEETFLSLAHKIQQETVETAKWQFYPVRNPVESPVYDVYYNYQNVAFQELCGLPVTFDLINSGHTHDLIDLQVRDFGGRGIYTVDLDLNAAAFDEEQGRRTLGHFLRLLEAFETDASRPIAAVDLLSPAERRQVEEWNATAVPRPPDLLLHGLVEAQIERTPEAEAVVDGDRRLTYRELGRAADRLARRLRSLGVGPDARVGVFAERSVEMVVALLGILKAGGAYVPLDPGLPAERLGFMAREAAMPVIVTQSRLAGAVPETGAAVLALDVLDGAGAIVEAPDRRPPVALDGANLAYVIFTSGSTGRPKGAMLPHAGICNRLLWMQEAYGLSPGDRVLQKTPFSFDVSVWEFFWPLITGATLVMARPGGHQDPAYLSAIVEEERITTLHFVPSMLQAFLAREEIGACSALKRVMMSGEALPEDLRQRFHQRLPVPGIELHNLYGPTEASVDVTFRPCPREAAAAPVPAIVPIGRPIANTAIYIVDRGSSLLPPGAAGELAIGGVSLARGYLGRPDLTAERFVPDPFAAQPGARLYRTGDLARHLPDGDIEYLGRLDHQVKLRGFRIELGEIEAAVARHPGVREAAVLLREDRPGDPRLVVYVTGDALPGVQELRAFLKDGLPDYMIPAAVVALESLPLTLSGKVDRRALPAPDQSAVQGAGEMVAPRTPLESLLASIWAEVLGLERVSVHDSFFELGGNSLTATRATTLVQEVLPVELSLRHVFESPTVARIAAHLEDVVSRMGAEEQRTMTEILAEFELLMNEEQETALIA
jgi:amino acid adenylation domain-containing protein